MIMAAKTQKLFHSQRSSDDEASSAKCPGPANCNGFQERPKRRDKAGGVAPKVVAKQSVSADYRSKKNGAIVKFSS
jgi:hypothetical protein